jgi:energy-coupling factor transporter ATP-binding protein EcfA2
LKKSKLAEVNSITKYSKTALKGDIMKLEFNDKKLLKLGKINVLLGKNGCGKSKILRELDASIRSTWSYVKYISPERGGIAEYSASIEDSLRNNPTWLDESRRKNHDDSFRQKSIVQLRNLETLINRKRSDDLLNGKPHSESERHFKEVLGLINSLLQNVELSTGEIAPRINGKRDAAQRGSDQLSSGEKELISLAAEILSFVYAISNSEQQPSRGLLLLDEPDTHLHPDLQYKLINLLAKEIENAPVAVIIATHSTAVLGALESYDAHVHFMVSDSLTLEFANIDNQIKEILPIFGAHPLSNIFSQKPVLLVEGEDDERIWQQAVKSSRGRIKLWPCVTATKDKLNEYEQRASKLIESVYDNASAYSLRDRDDAPYAIDDLPNVVRARTNCREVENLILCDEVLQILGTNWEQMQDRIRQWLSGAPNHQAYAQMHEFAQSFDRKNTKLKGLETVLIYLSGKNKPWEIAVGQAIGQMDANSSQASGGIRDFLGPKIVDALRLCI